MREVPDFVVRDPPDRDLRRVDSHPDHWYPLVWSQDVKPGRTHATHFAGKPIVLVRPKHGPVFALEDRCAHRQVPLSKGVVTGCTLRCCYHGWTYDRFGNCVDVPYLGKDKLPNGVRSYPCSEQDGLILIWPGDHQAVKELGPLGAAGDKAFKTRRFGKRVRCHYTFMHENLMDMNHQFLHRRQMGQIAPRYLGRRGGDDWLEVDYSFARTCGKQPLAEALILGRRRGVSTVPKDLMTIRTEYPYQTLRIWTSDDEPVMHLWIAYTPVDTKQ
jgi:phenylpropionate dioxygenase-like ring-hydroxylating dioxygenase large terminal subunit